MTQRRVLAATIIVVAAALAPVMTATAAQAAAYRYWSYWLGADGQWSFANVGPSSRVPADGTVDGWRFSVSGVAGNDRPSFAPDFDTVCADTPAQEGRKRVAVIVDPGLAQDAPDGEQPPGAWALCVVVDARASGYDVLRAAASVRVDDGLICSIGGYPARECAVVVDEPTPEPSPSPKPSKTPAPTKSPRPAPTATATPTSAPATAGAAATTTEARPTAAVVTTASPQRTPTPSPTAATTTPPESTPTPTPTPSPSLSVLAGPVTSDPGEGGSALGVGAAVLGIGVIGGGAVVLMRRRSP